MVKVEQPSPREHGELLVSSEVRAHRAAQKLGELSLDFTKRLKGRRRTEFENPHRLSLPPSPDVIEVGKVRALGKRLSHSNKPLFDQFTRHNRFSLNEESLRAYCRAQSTMRKIQPQDPGEKIEAERADQRRPFNIRDKVQQTLFDDRNIASLRRASLKATQYAIRNDQPIDEMALVNAADAIVDFGYCLIDNPETTKHMGETEFAIGFIHIGNIARTDPSILGENPDILRLAQIEQAKREKFWGDRFDLTVEVFGDQHLTAQNRTDGTWVNAEVARLQALCEA